MEFLKKVEPKGPISCDTVLKIFYQTCRAVQHMHKQKPPIIHRDLKVCYSAKADLLLRLLLNYSGQSRAQSLHVLPCQEYWLLMKVITEILAALQVPSLPYICGIIFFSIS